MLHLIMVEPTKKVVESELSGIFLQFWRVDLRRDELSIESSLILFSTR